MKRSVRNTGLFAVVAACAMLAMTAAPAQAQHHGHHGHHGGRSGGYSWYGGSRYVTPRYYAPAPSYRSGSCYRDPYGYGRSGYFGNQRRFGNRNGGIYLQSGRLSFGYRF